ncbi:MAG: methylmalonyl-CoA epimerase [Bacteroidota bacterium]
MGIAVENLDDSIKLYEDILGIKCYAVEEVKEQKVKTAFFKIGETKIELLESTDTDGPIGKFIEKKGVGIHHIAFAVKDIEKNLCELQEKSIQLVDIVPRKGAEGLDIAFVHPKSTQGILIEICEDKKSVNK